MVASAVRFMRLRCQDTRPRMSRFFWAHNRSDGMTPWGTIKSQPYGEQKGLRFVIVPFYDSSNFLPDMSRKGKCTHNDSFCGINVFCVGSVRAVQRWPIFELLVCGFSQVREPVVCSNQHVFCSNCMDMWLRSHAFCPTCRTSITAEKPCKKIIGKNFVKVVVCWLK